MVVLESLRRELWKGSLFRLPIRKISESEDSESDNNSTLTDVQFSPDTEYLLDHIKQWIEDVKSCLSFSLNHLTDIEFSCDKRSSKASNDSACKSFNYTY